MGKCLYVFGRDIIGGVKSYVVLLVFLVAAACSSPAKPAAETNAGAAAAPAPNENAALDALRRTNEAQSTYFKLNRRYALTFDELIEAHLLNSEPTPTQTGYDFKLRPAADAQTYRIVVDPAGADASVRHFYTDQTGVIRSETGQAASAESPQVP